MMHTDNTASQNPSKHQPRPMIDLLVSIVVPSLILMKFSADDALGARNALIVALALPISWGVYELARFRKFNLIALLGLISVMLTGGIGLLQLSPQWLAIKEAAVPGLIGIAVLISTFTRYPLIRTMLYNPSIMNVELISHRLNELGHHAVFEARLLNASYLLSATFLFSSVTNYFLAQWIVTSPAGSAAFNEELGQMTLLSYPMIAIPSMLMMLGIIYYLWRTLHDMTGLQLEDVLRSRE